MTIGQLELVVGKTSLEDNVTKIAETIALALDGKNEMLPYMDRIIKILPDIKGMLSLHEINHMILFDKWKEKHGYAEEQEPDYPDILWFLEELAIEPTLNDERIQKILPIRHQVYDSLKEQMIEGKPITEHIQELYNTSGNIEEFLERSYYFWEKRCRRLLGGN